MCTAASNHMCYMGYKQLKTSPMKIYNTAYNKSWTLGNKDPIMKMQCVNGASSEDTTLLNATNLHVANFAWAEDIMKNFAITPIGDAKLHSHVEFNLTILNFIMPVIHVMSYIVTWLRKDVNKGVMSRSHNITLT
jgi:hypothetical protein